MDSFLQFFLQNKRRMNFFLRSRMKERNKKKILFFLLGMGSNTVSGNILMYEGLLIYYFMVWLLRFL